jgi:hypothetical protein
MLASRRIVWSFSHRSGSPTPQKPGLINRLDIEANALTLAALAFRSSKLNQRSHLVKQVKIRYHIYTDTRSLVRAEQAD